MNKKGFTLIELIIVITVVSTLSAVAIPRVQNNTLAAERARAQVDVRNLNNSSVMIEQEDNGLFIPNNASADSDFRNEAFEKSGIVERLGNYGIDKLDNTICTSYKLRNDEVVSYPRNCHPEDVADEGDTSGANTGDTSGDNNGEDIPGEEENTSLPDHIPADCVLIGDEDVEFISRNYAPHEYTIDGVVSKGHFRYTGNDECVAIPETLKENVLQDYFMLFSGETLTAGQGNNTVKAVYAIDSSNIKDMSHMFRDSRVDTLFLDLDTRSVEKMESMFVSSKIKTIEGMENWDTSSLKVISTMFFDSELTEVNISNWNTSKLEKIDRAFAITKMNEIDLSGWNTSNVDFMHAVFYKAQAEVINVTGWNTWRVTNMFGMFRETSNLQTLDLSSFSTQSIDRNISFSHRAMFENTGARVGFARNSAEASFFNSMSDKPAGLTFTTK